MSVRIFIVTILAVLAAASHAERVRVPGTRLYIEPPAGFVPSPEFPGFVNPTARASISVAEAPASLLQLLEAYDDDGLHAKGIRNLARERMEKDGLRAEMVRGEQGPAGKRLAKIFLLTGDVSASVVVSATYIKRFGAAIGDQIYASLRDAVWESTDDLDQFEALGFRLGDVPGLRIATRVSNSVIFTRDGHLPDQYYAGRMLIVGWAKGDQATVKDRRAFAERIFSGQYALTEVTIDNTETVTINGHSGYETVGVGRHRNLGYETAAFQVTLFTDRGILMAQGFADIKHRDHSYGQFRTIIGTLKTD